MSATSTDDIFTMTLTAEGLARWPDNGRDAARRRCVIKRACRRLADAAGFALAAIEAPDGTLVAPLLGLEATPYDRDTSEIAILDAGPRAVAREYWTE